MCWQCVPQLVVDMHCVTLCSVMIMIRRVSVYCIVIRLYKIYFTLPPPSDSRVALSLWLNKVLSGSKLLCHKVYLLALFKQGGWSLGPGRAEDYDSSLKNYDPCQPMLPLKLLLALSKGVYNCCYEGFDSEQKSTAMSWSTKIVWVTFDHLCISLSFVMSWKLFFGTASCLPPVRISFLAPDP